MENEGVILIEVRPATNPDFCQVKVRLAGGGGAIAYDDVRRRDRVSKLLASAKGPRTVQSSRGAVRHWLQAGLRLRGKFG